MRTKSPWTSVFMTLDLCMEFVSAVQPFEQLTVNQVRLSECGELNWCGCLYKGTEDSSGGNLMIFMGNKQDIYLQVDGCT